MTMSLTLVNEQTPLKTGSDGVVRVGKTRVTLESVIAAFNEGATAEEIVYRYPSLHLADVYAVISYYLRRPGEVEEYVKQRRQIGKQVRLQNRDFFHLDGIRARLLARRDKQEKSKDAGGI